MQNSTQGLSKYRKFQNMSTNELSMEVFEENVEKTEMQKRIISWKAEATLFCDKKSEIVDYVKSKISDYQKQVEERRREENEKEERRIRNEVDLEI